MSAKAFDAVLEVRSMPISVLAKGFIIIALLPAIQPCKPIKHTIKVDRAAVKQLQVFVNEGHEPWRMDAKSVAAERILLLRKVKTTDHDVFNVPLEQVSSSETHATFQYKGSSKNYRVTVQRFAWLLPLAKQWKWAVWTATEEETIPNCGELRKKQGDSKSSQ
ncbi:MAG: hypothetical protein ROO76_18550 [Terriglobia bacterium]|nr:hypothetical protein [Terriglobia bacterium]